MTNSWVRRILGHRRTRALAVLVLLAGLTAPLMTMAPAVYAIHVKQAISSGSVVEVFINDFSKQPILLPAAPGGSTDYVFKPWNGPITRLRLDPTNTEGADIAIGSVEIRLGQAVVKGFSAGDVSGWSCDGIERLTGDARTLRLRATTNDPVCISPTLDVPAPDTDGGFIGRVFDIARMLLGCLPFVGGLLLAGHALSHILAPAAKASTSTAVAAGWRSHLPLILAYAMLGTVMSLRLGQDMNYDLRNYHFYNPYLLFANRFDRDVQAAGIQTFQSPTFDLLTFAAIRMWGMPPVLIGIALGAFHGLALWLVHVLVRLVVAGQRAAVAESLGALAAVIAAFGSGYRGELGTTFGDNTFAVFVLGALAALLASCAAEAKVRLSLVRLAGLLAGIAVGGKLVAASYMVGLGAAALLARPLWRERLLWARTFAIFAAIGVSLAGGYWMWLMQAHYGSPLFPFYNVWFRSPFASTASNFSLAAWYAPKDAWTWWLLPFVLVGKQPLVGSPVFRDFRLAAATLAVLALAATCWSRPAAANGSADSRRRLDMLAIFSVVSYIVWLRTFAVYRFVIPLELVSAVLVVGCAAAFLRRAALLLPAVLVVGGALVFSTTPMDWGRAPWSSSYFGVDEAALQPYDQATVLLWGQPNSYLVPHFPSGTTFVRPLDLEGGPDPRTEMFRQVEARVAAATRLFSLETPAAWPEYRNAMLDRLGLSIDHTQCHLISTIADTSRICSMVRRPDRVGR